jgi:amino acid adenylation domain-containing protein
VGRGSTTRTLAHLLRAAAERSPQATAASFGDARLTYADLDHASDRVAAWLRAEGVCRGDRVAICSPKSLAAVVAVWGILKAGAAYVPIDSFAPPRRTAFILQDCGVRHIVASDRPLEALLRLSPAALSPLAVLATETLPAGSIAGHRITPWAALPDAPTAQNGVDASCRSQDLAYILYTSGSTGEPKGVAISHRAALAFVEWAVDAFGLGADDRLSNHAPLHFDLSILDLFGAAAAGASVVLIPESLLPFPLKLADVIEGRGISVWYSVPSAPVQLTRSGALRRRKLTGLRLVLFAGEVFPVGPLRELMAELPQARFWNLYGPTETNVCTSYEVPPLDPARTAPVPIGRPCPYASALAVHEDGRAIQAGEVGELLVGGDSLMEGYWGRPERTAEILVPHPHDPGHPGRVYRTGDLVRLEADGNYSFAGRRDHMVKLRGYRIELGEIEAVLHEHPGVAAAAALLDPQGPDGHRLLAVVAPRTGATVSAAVLRRHCAERLPRYMVPEAVELHPELPRTPTGKIDRRALGTLVIGTGAGPAAP